MEHSEPGIPSAVHSARDRAVLATGRSISSLFIALGILAALRTGMDEPAQLAFFSVSPAIAGVWLALGLLGVAMAVGPRACRVYLLGEGALLIVWAIAGVAVDGTEDGLFIGDAPLTTLHLVTGAICLLVALIPARHPAPEATPPSRPSEVPD